MGKYDNFLDDENIKKKRTRSSKKDKKVNNIFMYIILTLTLLSVFILFIVTYKNSANLVNKLEEVLKVSIIVIFTLFFVLSNIFMEKKGNLFTYLASFILIGYSVFNIGLSLNYINLPTQDIVDDFTNKNLTEVVKWANKNNIKLEQIYETSDLVEEYKIISQNHKEGTLLKEVKSLTVVVSSGPSYDKTVIIPSFVGQNVDDVIKFVDDNFLTGVNIDFVESEEKRDNIISQDKNGEIRRSDVVNMVASIGSLSDIGEMKMKDLVGLDTFHSTTWLKRYGFKYIFDYEYSNDVPKGSVLKQSIEKDASVNPLETEVTLTISKGPKIVVPNLSEKTVDEITNWVVENNLKVTFEEQYDESVELGSVISVSVTEGEEIEQGSLITVIISKGQIKMEKFTSSADFRAWAEKYGVNYNEEYKFDEKVASGNIIESSHKEGDIIKNSDTVTIVISQGKSVTVPNFVGKTKGEISKTCDSLKLKCSYKYGGYNDSVARDTATAQNKKNGSKVMEGTSVVITLSSGKAKSYDVVIQSNWLSPGNPDSTISTLKSKLQAACPGVTFKFVKKTVNTGVGLITPDSPVKGGKNTFKEGKTYTIYVGTA